LHPLPGCASIIPLVKIHPGFLSAEHVNQVPDSVNLNRDIPGHASVSYPGFKLKAFEGARGSVISKYQRFGPEKIDQQFPHQLFHLCHPDGPDLVDQNVSVTVDDKAGKAVRFAKDKPAALRGRVDVLSKTRRIEEPLSKEFLIGLLAGGANDAHGDQRCRIDIAGTQREAFCSEYLNPASGLKIMDRIGYFVAENPAMPLKNAPLTPWIKDQVFHVIFFRGRLPQRTWRPGPRKLMCSAQFRNGLCPRHIDTIFTRE
jgi:hypothetical protein